MWFLDRLRKRKYDRKYRAALAVYIGTYLPEKLDAESRKRLNAEAAGIVNEFPDGGAALRKIMPWQGWGCVHAVAMLRLGIEPPIPGLYWRDLVPDHPRWVPFFPSCDTRVADIASNFWPFDSATADAREFLRRNRWDIPERDPIEKGSQETIGIWGDAVKRYPYMPPDK